jgi:hypothetical protein
VVHWSPGGDFVNGLIAKAAHDVCGGNGVGRFLVTNVAAFEAADVFEVLWLDASGKEVRLEV